MLRQATAVTMLACCLTLSGCTSKSQEAADQDAQKSGAAGAHFGDVLPDTTLAYVRLTDPRRVKENLVQAKDLINAAAVQQQINELFTGAIQSIRSDENPLHVSGETVLAIFNDLQAVHLAVLPHQRTVDYGDGQTRTMFDPQPALVFEMRSKAAIDRFFQEAGAAFEPREMEGTPVKVAKMGGRELLVACNLSDTNVLVGTETTVQAVLKQKQAGGDHALAGAAGFRQALADFGGQGELFGYVNLDALRTHAPIPLNTLSRVAGSMAADGKLAVRAYAADGRDFPDFLVRTSRPKTFFQRVPADAVLVYDWSYDGGKNTRQRFTDWVKEELGAGTSENLDLLPPQVRQMAQALTENSDKLETEVVVMFQDLWMAVIPVKTEMALFIAPGEQGQWGGALMFDVEDCAQAETLARKIFDEGKRHDLPWQETTHEGLTIHYLDVKQLIAESGSTVPEEFGRLADLEVGYALSDQMFYAGTVGAIKFAHKPTSKTLDAAVATDGIDKENALQLTLQPGKVVHRQFGIKPVDDVLVKAAAGLPESASYSLTLQLEKRQATLRSNVPLSGLIAWLGLEFAQQARTAGPSAEDAATAAQAEILTQAVRQFEIEQARLPVGGLEAEELFGAMFPRSERPLVELARERGLELAGMDDSEALVFWLAGVREREGSTRLRYFSDDPTRPLDADAKLTRSPFVEFQPDRLVDRDEDGWLECVAPAGGRYVLEGATVRVETDIE